MSLIKVSVIINISTDQAILESLGFSRRIVSAVVMLPVALSLLLGLAAPPPPPCL